MTGGDGDDGDRTDFDFLTRRRLLGMAGLTAAGAFPGQSVALTGGDELVGEIDSVTANEAAIAVAGSLSDPAADADWTLELYELAPYEEAAVHLTRDPVTETQYAAGDGTFEVGVGRFDGQRDRYHSKFLVVGRQGADIAQIDHPHYVTDAAFDPINATPGPKPQSKKGLRPNMIADAEELGISSCAVNIVLDFLLFETNPGGDEAIVHEMDGEEFYVQRWYVEALDRRIGQLTDNGVEVGAVLLLLNLDVPNAPVEQLLHPDADEGAQSATVFAFNTTDASGIRYYKAALDFLMSRYSRDDMRYGRLRKYVVGNEVDAQWVWYNMGEKPLEEMVADYEPAVRLADQLARKYHGESAAHISLTHSWTEAHDPNALRYYPGRDVIDEMNRASKRHGDYPWNVAHHPYPEDLFDPRWWEDQTAEDSANSPRVTFKNLHVLRDYLRRDDQRYRGAQRRIDLTEQGFHTVDGTEAAEREQAAAYAYAYYKVHFLDGVDSFLYHRHVDHALEGGLLLGLWSHDPDHSIPNAPKAKKRSYGVFRRIDTEESLRASEFAKDVVGIDAWGDVISNFDPDALAQRSLPARVGAEPIKKTKDAVVIDAFDADVGDWEAAEGAESVARTTADATVGAGSLEVEFNRMAKLWRGAQLRFDSPRDVGERPYLSLALKLPDADLTEDYYAKVKAFDGRDTAEAIVAIEPTEGWHRVALPLHEWRGVESVDRLKVWVRAGRDNGEQWLGKLLIDAVEVSADVVSAGGAANVDIAIEASETLAAGDEVTFTITNYDPEALTGEMEVGETSEIALAADAFHVGGLELGESRSFTTTVTRFDPPEAGAVTVPFTYRDWTTQTAVWEYEPFTLLTGFEDGTVDGWQAGANVTSVAAVESFVNGPGRPYAGSYALEATSKQAPANAWRTVTLSFDQPLDLTDAAEFVYRFDAYGFGPSAGSIGDYETRLTLESGAETLTAVHETAVNRWNEIRTDIGGWSGRDAVTALSVSFRQSTNPIVWAPKFQLDDVGYVAKTK